jgi:uncharacterized protein
VKIDINNIPPQGQLTFEEEIEASSLDLDTGILKFREPIKIKADISRITNAVTIDLILEYLMYANCSRCLNEFKIDFKKSLKLNYPVNDSGRMIDLDPAIREEIILDYPMKPLCSPNCKGLCLKCGKNLNEGGCFCATT